MTQRADLDACLRLAAGAFGQMALRHAQPCEQFADAERLGQVVVGAQIQRGDLVAFAAACRQHQDRLRIPLAQAADDVEAGNIRQAEIDDDDIRLMQRSQAQALVSGGGDFQCIAMRFQGSLQETLDLQIVFDGEQAHRGAFMPPSPSWWRRGRRCQRQGKTEFSAAGGQIARADRAVVRFDNRLADSQAEAESALRTFVPGALEFVEHAPFCAGRQARALVAHGDGNDARLDRRRDPDRGAGGVCFCAFSTRLPNTCPIMTSSQNTSGRSAGTSTATCWPASASR